MLIPWWRHLMESFSALLALCEGNSSVAGEFPSQSPVTRSFDVFFDLRLNKRFSKQSKRRWFETSQCSLWRQCNSCAILIAHQLLWQNMEAPVSIFQESPLAGEPPQRQPFQTLCKISLPVYVIVTNERLQPCTTTWYNSLVLSFSLLKIVIPG